MSFNFSLLTWLGGGPLEGLDMTPDLETLAMLDQPAACDKHRELVKDMAEQSEIEQLQAKIVANGGSVTHHDD